MEILIIITIITSLLFLNYYYNFMNYYVSLIYYFLMNKYKHCLHRLTRVINHLVNETKI